MPYDIPIPTDIYAFCFSILDWSANDLVKLYCARAVSVGLRKNLTCKYSRRKALEDEHLHLLDKAEARVLKCNQDRPLQQDQLTTLAKIYSLKGRGFETMKRKEWKVMTEQSNKFITKAMKSGCMSTECLFLLYENLASLNEFAKSSRVFSLLQQLNNVAFTHSSSGVHFRKLLNRFVALHPQSRQKPMIAKEMDKHFEELCCEKPHNTFLNGYPMYYVLSGTNKNPKMYQDIQCWQRYFPETSYVYNVMQVFSALCSKSNALDGRVVELVEKITSKPNNANPSKLHAHMKFDMYVCTNDPVSFALFLDAYYVTCGQSKEIKIEKFYSVLLNLCAVLSKHHSFIQSVWRVRSEMPLKFNSVVTEMLCAVFGFQPSQETLNTLDGIVLEIQHWQNKTKLPAMFSSVEECYKSRSDFQLISKLLILQSREKLNLWRTLTQDHSLSDEERKQREDRYFILLKEARDKAETAYMALSVCGRSEFQHSHFYHSTLVQIRADVYYYLGTNNVHWFSWECGNQRTIHFRELKNKKYMEMSLEKQKEHMNFPWQQYGWDWYAQMAIKHFQLEQYNKGIDYLTHQQDGLLIDQKSLKFYLHVLCLVYSQKGKESMLKKIFSVLEWSTMLPNTRSFLHWSVNQHKEAVFRSCMLALKEIHEGNYKYDCEKVMKITHTCLRESK